MENKIYVIKYSDIKEFNACVGFESLKNLCEKLAMEDFAIEIDGKTEVLEQAFIKGDKSHYGYLVNGWKDNISDELAFKACQEVAEIGGAEIEVLEFQSFTNVKAIIGFGQELELKLLEFSTEAELNAYLKGVADMDGWNSWFTLETKDFHAYSENEKLKFLTVEEGLEAIKETYRSCKSCELQDFMQKNILSEEEKDDLIAEIYSWHENCEHGQNGECEIFNAIEQGAEDDEVISIAFKVDRDLFDKFEKMPKYIESVSTEKVELDMYECTCGFHLGIDATYLEQVSEVSIVCPSCGNSILTTEHDGCNSDSLENKSKPFDANNYTSRQLLEMEFQNVPNSTHKDNLIAEALQLVEVNGYTVGEAANEVLAEKRGV